MSKIPKKLTLGFLFKIVEDIIDSKTLDDIVKYSNQKYTNTYDYIYILSLCLLEQTDVISVSKSGGLSSDIVNINLNKTIKYNTLADRRVYSESYQTTWLCNEHKMFLFLLQYCNSRCSSYIKTDKELVKRLKGFKSKIGLSIEDIRFNQNHIVKIFNANYNTTKDCLKDKSLLNKNPRIYLVLCRLLNIILNSITPERSNDGNENISFNKIEYYIIQQYGVRELWNVINRYTVLNSLKHRYYQETIYAGNSSSMKPDAVYIFDNNYLTKSFIVDVKFYSKSVLNESGVYNCTGLRGQMTNYSLEFPDYLKTCKYSKTNKVINSVKPTDFTNWILHFRVNATKSEKNFSGSLLDIHYAKVGVYIVDLTNSIEVKDVDAQLESFVKDYILKIA